MDGLYLGITKVLDRIAPFVKGRNKVEINKNLNELLNLIKDKDSIEEIKDKVNDLIKIAEEEEQEEKEELAGAMVELGGAVDIPSSGGKAGKKINPQVFGRLMARAKGAKLNPGEKAGAGSGATPDARSELPSGAGSGSSSEAGSGPSSGAGSGSSSGAGPGPQKKMDDDGHEGSGKRKQRRRRRSRSSRRKGKKRLTVPSLYGKGKRRSRSRSRGRGRK